MAGLDLTGLSEEALLAELPVPVRQRITEMSGRSVPEDQIGAVLALAPGGSIARKGAGSWRADLWPAVVQELRVLCCTDDARYADIRDKWTGLQGDTASTAVAALSGAIGASLGLAAGVVAPVVVWGLVTVLRLGLGVFCRQTEPKKLEVPAG